MSTIKEVIDRLIRIETMLFKLAAHIGMDPTTGKPLRDLTEFPGPARNNGEPHAQRR